MPNRIIKESIRTSDTISSLSDFEFRLWVGLIVSADDAGRGDARPAIIKGQVFPLRDRVTIKDISAALHGLAAKGCVSLYEVGGKPYFWFPTWKDHQRIRDCKPKFPDPALADKLPQVAEVCGELPQVAARIQSESESNPNPNPKETPAQAREASAPAHAAKGKYGEYGWVRLTQEEYSRLLAEFGPEELARCIQYVDESAQKSGNKNRWKDWNLVIRSCHREGWGLRNGRQGGTPDYAKPVDAEKAQADLNRMERLLEKMGGGE